MKNIIVVGDRGIGGGGQQGQGGGSSHGAKPVAGRQRGTVCKFESNE